MRKYLLSTFFFFCCLSLFSQELMVKAKVENPSNLINDGIITLEVEGGVPPYTYRWSDQSTALDSPRASGLTEGVPYSVVVTDASGKTVTQTFEIKPEAITESFNGFMTPAVDNLAAVLFWDPFSAIGIYDPVVYANGQRVAAPGWEAGIASQYILKEWIVAEGERVRTGDLIAIVTKDGQDLETFANANGTLEHLAAEGEMIYNFENIQHVVEEGAHNFAYITYDEPVALTHPNGDPQTKEIPFIVVWLVLGALFFTFRMGFINIRGFKHALQLARGKFDDPNAPG